MEARHHGITVDTPIEHDGRLSAVGHQLIDIHLSLREELDRLREGTDAWLDGRGERPRELRANCLAFCSAVTRHHTGEDTGAFPELARRHPKRLVTALNELPEGTGTAESLLGRSPA